MKSLSAAALAISVIALCLACAVGYYVHGSLGVLDERADMASHAQSSAQGDGRDSAAIASLEARIDALESALPLPREQAAAAARDAAVESGAAAGTAARDAAGSGSRPDHGSRPGSDNDSAAGASAPKAGAETIEAKVRKLESEFEAIRKKVEERESDGSNPRFDKFVAKMDLTPAQAQSSLDILVKGQTDLLDMMKTPLPDGTIMADRFADAFASAMDGSEEGKARVGELLKTLITEKVPGSDETYLTAIERVNHDIASRMSTVLNVDQQRKFREWGVKPTDIEIENGPFQRHIIEYIKANRGSGK